MKIQNLFTLFLLTTFFYACQNITQNETSENTLNTPNTENINTKPLAPNAYATKTTVQPPLENVDVPLQSFTINAQKAQVIEIKETGTSIEIPANAFVDEQGNIIQGEVIIDFKEYHDVGDILASGIPMQMTAPDGSTGFMQSAGMFDIQGKVANQEEGSGAKAIFIAEDKALKVNLASYKNDGEYDAWRLDEGNKQWLNKGLSQVEKNKNKAKALKYVEKNKPKATPIKPYKFDKNKPVLEFDINLKNFPELKEMNGVMWQYAGSDDTKDPAKNKWVYEENWDAVEVDPIKESNLYQLKLRNKFKEFTSVVCPSQSNDDFKKSMAEYNSKLKEYEENKVTYEDMQALAETQADFIRSYSVNGFGIYNYDLMMKDDEFIPLLADFDFGVKIPGAKQFTTVYMIYNDRNVVCYPPNQWSSIRIDPKGKTKMVAILPGNKFATISATEFEVLVDDIKEAKNSHYTFKMTYHKENAIASLEELKTIIEGLV